MVKLSYHGYNLSIAQLVEAYIIDHVRIPNSTYGTHVWIPNSTYGTQKEQK